MLTMTEAAISTMDRPDTYREEAEHRIANSLQIIGHLVRQKAKSGHVSDPRIFLLEVADRIETVGKLHRFLRESTTGTVQLRAYVKEVCDRLTGALAPAATSFSFDCPKDRSLPAKTALSLGLITAELISNSIKYAHPAGLPTRISLFCDREENERLKITYEDDGVGFPEGFDINEAGHMGMNFIRLLSTGLGGHHEWHSDPLGIRFEIIVPISS
jgi:two-component sensor histidine kinase